MNHCSHSAQTPFQTGECLEHGRVRCQQVCSCHSTARTHRGSEKSTVSNDSPPARSASSLSISAAARSLTYMPIDERVSQSLVGRSVALQQPQLATSFVMASFPCYYKATESRVPITWIDYITDRHSQANNSFDWAVRSMTTMYLGSLHNDSRYLNAGRMCYLRSLRGLSKMLGDKNAAKSDEALSTVIILGVFEMHAYTSLEGWKHHARGLRTLMQLRGPSAHEDGFGCNLYMACRNTLITSALVSGEECFLEQQEWQQLNRHLAAKNAKNANSSVLEDIAERAFREVVKLPGFVKRLRDLHNLTPNVQKHERPALLRTILTTRTTIRGIHTEFIISASTLGTDHEPHPHFIGPMPHVYFRKFWDLTIQGIRSSLLLLNYLIIILNPSQQFAAEEEIRDILESMQAARNRLSQERRQNTSPLSSAIPSGSSGQLNLMIESRLMPETSQPPTTDWMDQIAGSMGMEGVQISLVNLSNFQNTV